MTDQELARDLGFLEAYTIGLGTMIGAGIFVLPSIAARAAGPASMISFAIGGLVSLLAALSLSELATGMPKAGGSYYYVNRSLGSFFGSIVGWGMWAGLMFASAFYMLGFGQYLTYFVPMGATGVAIAALVMAAVLTGVNYYGVKETGTLQNVIVLALVGLIIVFIVFGVLSVDTEMLTPFLPPEGWPAVAATAGTIYVSFIGFEVIATSAEEIKNPSRNLPLSMIAAVVTPTLMYVLVMFVSTGTLPIDTLADLNIPVAVVAETVMRPFGRIEIGPISFSMAEAGAFTMVVGAMLATVSSANASILSAARVNFAMGRDKILTNWLNQVHDRFRTPYRAIVATGAVILVLIASGVPIGTLAEVASFSYLITYSLVHVAVVVMRRADPDDYDPAFEIPSILYPIVPIVGFLACIAILLQMSWIVQAVGVAIVLVGVVWYFAYARHRAITDGLVGEAIAAEPTAAADGKGNYRVVVPVANPDTERDLLRLAAANAHAHEDEQAEIIAVNVIQVPQQTSLSQDVEFEEERVQRQQELLDAAQDIAADLDIGIRTRAIVGRDVGDVVLDVVEDERADHVLMGWKGTRSAREHILGSNIDQIVKYAPCKVTLAKLATTERVDTVEDVVALAGEGPHAPVAASHGAELVDTAQGAGSLTLLNAQRPDDDADPQELGEAVIEDVARRAGIEYVDYESRVVVGEDIEEVLLDAVAAYDTVCVGATRSGSVSQALFGSIPEKIGEEVDATVVMVRGQKETARSVRQGIIDRLSG
ncbi:amino acid permease [Halorussus gelatinilyticus]|uniref:Amino acid permease n=1 Tax=Halorussus gelatinilyticus TaxID=2937524 RepID=A0A8U0IH36_9EURY|nr:amino acid permease [Halorussus gelatinilyticus]UPW00377.1 amino acid permease [Halorussus gelatinilyticus]